MRGPRNYLETNIYRRLTKRMAFMGKDQKAIGEGHHLEKVIIMQKPQKEMKLVRN